MTVSTDASGVAVCGSCGSELEVRCTGGCAEPDIMARENYIASLPRPRGKETPNSAKQFPERRPTQCTVPGCDDERAPRRPGRGRPATKCPRHLEMQNACRARWNKKTGVVIADRAGLDDPGLAA